ncbi:MAG TPA: hypothetical protein VIL07_02150 [Symbiobacteriaceae bacterium]
MEASQALVRLKEAARRGDYAGAVRNAALLVPGKQRELDRFRMEMEQYERAVRTAQWRAALRALAAARMAAVAAGLPELEDISTDQMYRVIRLREQLDREGQSCEPAARGLPGQPSRGRN